eukprot:3039436-Rhodomonas_salina.2
MDKTCPPAIRVGPRLRRWPSGRCNYSHRMDSSHASGIPVPSLPPLRIIHERHHPRPAGADERQDDGGQGKLGVTN